MKYKKPLFILYILFNFIHVMSQSENVQIFHLDELVKNQQHAADPWHEFLHTETMQAGLYYLKAGQEDKQGPHKLDEVYYVISGKAKFTANNKMLSVGKGSILFVRATVAHHFHDITEDLAILVIFSTAPSDAHDVAASDYDLKKIMAGRKTNENVWDPFLNCKTLNFGLYMLPKSVGGDSTLKHKVDELNIITAGQGKFSVEGSSIDVKEGDIMYVKKEQGHYFHSLASDMDILILFEKKSSVN